MKEELQNSKEKVSDLEKKQLEEKIRQRDKEIEDLKEKQKKGGNEETLEVEITENQQNHVKEELSRWAKTKNGVTNFFARLYPLRITGKEHIVMRYVKHGTSALFDPFGIINWMSTYHAPINRFSKETQMTARYVAQKKWLRTVIGIPANVFFWNVTLYYILDDEDYAIVNLPGTYLDNIVSTFQLVFDFDDYVENEKRAFCRKLKRVTKTKADPNGKDCKDLQEYFKQQLPLKMERWMKDNVTCQNIDKFFNEDGEVKEQKVQEMATWITEGIQKEQEKILSDAYPKVIDRLIKRRINEWIDIHEEFKIAIGESLNATEMTYVDKQTGEKYTGNGLQFILTKKAIECGAINAKNETIDEEILKPNEITVTEYVVVK